MGHATVSSDGGASGDLDLARVTKEFGTFTAVDDIDLTIPQGSFFALLGPSGCGKTTTLRMVAGLEDPTAGRILIGDHRHHRDQAVPAAGQHGVPELRAVPAPGRVRERRVRAAAAAGPRPSRSRSRTSSSSAELVALARRKPAQLSGGQQQRVALARAIVNRPAVLLLDEPLGALDLKLRRQMQIELKRIQTEVGLTFVHVTHDQEEAMTMADTIAVMNAGRIEQLGAPATLYELAAHDVRRELPRPVQPGRVHRDRHRPGDRLVADMHGTSVLIALSRSAVQTGTSSCSASGPRSCT